jgi:hypothetical protein
VEVQNLTQGDSDSLQQDPGAGHGNGHLQETPCNDEQQLEDGEQQFGLLKCRGGHHSGKEQHQQQRDMDQEQLQHKGHHAQQIVKCGGGITSAASQEGLKPCQKQGSDNDLLMCQLFPDQQALSAAGRRVDPKEAGVAVVVGMVQYAMDGEQQGREVVRQQPAPAAATAEVSIKGQVASRSTEHEAIS